MKDDDLERDALSEYSTKLGFSGAFIGAVLGVVVGNYLTFEKLSELRFIDTFSFVVAFGMVPILIFQTGQIALQKHSFFWLFGALFIGASLLAAVYFAASDLPLGLRQLFVIAWGGWTLIALYSGFTSRIVRRHLYSDYGKEND